MTFDDLPNKLVCFHYVCDENYQIRDFPSGPVIKTWPSNAGGAGSIPGQGAKIPPALWPKTQNIKQKQYRNKFNKDFKKSLKSGPHQEKYFKKKQGYYVPHTLVMRIQ